METIVLLVIRVFWALALTLLGLASAWIVGWFFTDTFLGIFAAIGITGFKMWQIGAVLGFFSSFFKSPVKSIPKYLELL